VARRIIRIFTWTLALLVLLTAGLYAYLRNADLSMYQDHIEALVTKSIGHELQVGGRFELQFGATTTVVAEDVVLSNPDWPDTGELIRVEHLTFAFDTWSLLSRPFIVEELRTNGIRGRLVRGPAGRFNWVSERVAPREEPGAPLDLNRLAFRVIDIRDAEFVLEDPARPRPLHLDIETLSVTPDDNGILDLDLRGDINDLDLWADGKLGPWRNFINGRDISADLDLTLGQVNLSLTGTVADLLRLEGLQLNAKLGGPDIGRVLDKMALPQFATGEFAVAANIEQQQVGHRVRVEGNVGRIQLFASGSVDSLLKPQSADHDFSISGPDAQDVAALFGIAGVPEAPFQVSGDYTRQGKLLNFENALLRVGENSVSFAGSVDLDRWAVDMSVSADGPDFSIIGPFVDVRGLPADSFSLSGRVRREGRAWQADNVDARVGENRLNVSGEIETGSNVETRIALQVDGPDISILQDFTDLEGIPSRPFDIDVVVRSHPAGILVEQGTGIFGDNRIDAEGTVVLAKGFDGSSGFVRVSGPEFHNVALISGVPYLPPGPFDASCNVAVRGEMLHLDGVSASVGDFEGSASGQIAIRGAAIGQFDLDITLAGPDLAALPEVKGLDDFAGDAFRVSGQLARAADVLTATNLDVSVGGLDATVDGSMIGAAQRVSLSISANSSDSVMVRKIAKLHYLPDGPVIVEGDIEKSGNEIRFTDTVVTVGDYRVAANGGLSMQPRANNSDLEFSISGPSLYEAGQVVRVPLLADKPFSVSGKFSGTPTGFEMRDFVARVGESDLHGEFDANLEGKPRVVGILASTYLDLTDRIPAGEEEEQAEVAEEAGDDRLFPDDPLDTSWLQSANVDVELRIDQLISNALNVTNVDIGVRLQDGALRVDPFFFRDDDGTVEASFSLGPEDGRYRLVTWMEIDGIHAGVLAPDDDNLASLPPLSGTMRFAGVGNSVRSIMASSNGQISMRQGAGKVREVFGSALFRDVLLEVLRMLNPLRRAREFQLLECGIYDVSVEDGLAKIDNFIIQTDSMTTVASGEVNLRNERLEIAFRAKPREGLGISLGTVANRLLEVGGTLKDPRIRVDAGRTATTAGAAVATGGLSLLARGLWDRLSAEGDICDKEPRKQ
jgi:uncharacterized protein involved in outer membrane biogenesis